MASATATIKALDQVSLDETSRRRLPASSRHFPSSLIDEASFVRVLRLENKRVERSRARFMLMVLDCEELFRPFGNVRALAKIVSVISSSTRETDTLGWYEDGKKLGVVFTEIGTLDSSVSKIVERITMALRGAATPEEFKSLDLMVQVFANSSSADPRRLPSDLSSYPNLGDDSRIDNTTIQHAPGT